MNIEGLNVNAQAIADGLYEIICDKGEEAIVAFGMIPKWIIDLTEKLVRDKIIAIWASQLQVTVAEAMPYVDEAKLNSKVQGIIREVCTDIYGAAKKQGKMVV